MEVLSRVQRSRRMQRHAGMTLIEALIAVAIIGIVGLSIMPLFGRAIASNQSGNQSSQVANFGRAGGESFSSLPFDRGASVPVADDPLRVPDGAAERLSESYFVADGTGHPTWEGSWLDGPPPPAAGERWIRRVRVQQFGVSAYNGSAIPELVPGDPIKFEEFVVGEAVDGGSLATVQLKLIEVEVESQATGGFFLRGPTLRMQMLKAF